MAAIGLHHPPADLTHRSAHTVSYGHDHQEDLADLHSCISEESDEMGELSDSPSSQPSLSRPATPSNPTRTRPAQTHSSRNEPTSSPEKNPNEPFSLAQKAERILGLTPGTLSHALACLQNARDEVRRSAGMNPDIPPTDHDTSEDLRRGNARMRGRIFRVRKSISVKLPSPIGPDRTPSVVLGTGGLEEEDKRERRRRAADGVLYWQKEVAKLQTEGDGRL